MRFLVRSQAVSITEYGILVAFPALVAIAIVESWRGLSGWFATKTNSITY